MFVATNLAGFGPITSPDFATATGDVLNSNSPQFSVDLGPPGKKQVVAAFSMYDNDVSDAFGVSATFDGDAMTKIRDAGHFNGVSKTCGVSVFIIETVKGGSVIIRPSLSGFAGTMDRTVMGAFILRGYSTTEVDYVSTAQDADAANGNAANGLNITGASLVVITGVDLDGSPGNVTGGDAPVTLITGARQSIGYDLALAGTSNNYDFASDTEAIIAVSFAKS